MRVKRPAWIMEVCISIQASATSPVTTTKRRVGGQRRTRTAGIADALSVIIRRRDAPLAQARRNGRREKKRTRPCRRDGVRDGGSEFVSIGDSRTAIAEQGAHGAGTCRDAQQ